MPKPAKIAAIKAISLPEIQNFAKKIALKLKGGEIFSLVGQLGSGKTTFVQAMGRHLKVKGKITSPTFILMQNREGKLKGNKIFFYHLDLYRTKNFKEIKALGITEFWGKPQTVVFIEWADKIKKYLPKKTIFLKFKNE